MSIKEDKNRFREIIKGKVRDNLKEYITQSSMTGRQEKDLVKIPIHSIDIPNFRFGKGEDQEGVGHGGEEGMEEANGQPGDGSGKAGSEAGEHMMETEFTVSELAQILGEKLELPELKPKGNKNLKTDSRKYSSLAPVGPAGLRHFKHTYKKALKKSISSGGYNYLNPKVVPNKQDYIFKSSKETSKPFAQAVVFYLMDISGSMGDREKNIVQSEVFWLNAWLSKHYKGLESRFIVHDAKAWEVKEEDFFKISAQGGTLISSSYRACLEIIKNEYPTDDWNIYVFQFSDGDNWSGEDTKVCIDLIEKEFLPVVNSFNYGQVESKYGSGQFMKDLQHSIKSQHDKVKLSSIQGKEGILDSIKEFLGKG